MGYSNPFGAFNTNYGGAGQQGFVNQTETMETSQKNEMARPFIDMDQKSAGLDLQKQQIEHDEFGSPEAKQMRAQKIIQESKQIEANLQKINPQLALDLQDIQQKMQLGPLETANKIIQAQQLGSQLKGKPVGDFINAAADWGNAYLVSKQDPLEQATAYRRFIKDYQDTHPDTQIPPNFENWSANLGKHLAGAKMISIMTSAHMQDMEKTKMTSDATIESHRISAKGTTDAAAITARASERNNQRTVDGKESSAEQKALDHVQTSVDKARQNIFMIGLGLPPDKKKEAQDEYIKGVRQDALENYNSIVGGKKSPSVGPSGLKAQVEASGYEFQPDKYDYGINPATGKLARRPKGDGGGSGGGGGGLDERIDEYIHGKSLNTTSDAVSEMNRTNSLGTFKRPYKNVSTRQLQEFYSRTPSAEVKAEILRRINEPVR